ncbi:sortase [Patescibacteria group bacterium]|nr:sortase [Patescibacteria group bacterium]
MQTRKGGIIPRILNQPKSFSATFVGIFLLSYAFLWGVGATPDPTAAVAQTPAASQQELSQSGAQEAPVRVVAKNIGLDVAINNPTSTDIEVLDQALLSGAVRYPTSALLGEEGTVLLFGHSSNLPVVYNQAYKAFNSIQNLKSGQMVSVYSGSAEYRYSVVGVKLADADEDVIEMPKDGKRLVLVTCDLSFAKKTARFVVTAEFVGTYALASN